MDFRLGERAEQLRKETAGFLDEHLTAEILEDCHRRGVNHDPGFAAAVRDQGWLTLDWPVELGGQGRDPMEVLGHYEEMRIRGAPMYAIGTTMTVARLVQEIGTAELKAAIVAPALAAEVIIALGITEPENGSDAAAAATRAVRTGDGWTISGSKMFTTNAHIADYVFMLARTNPEAPKHRGLTVFVVPMDQPGVEVQAVHTMSGERTNITFYNDVFVPDLYRIGEVDAGWAVMGRAFQTEHSACFVGEQIRLLDALVDWARDTAPVTAAVTECVGRNATDIEVSILLDRRSAWQVAEGGGSDGRESMVKLFSTERLERQAEATLDVIGRDALRAWGDSTTVQGGRIEHTVRHAKGTTIYAGTSEIQRTIIAEHVLGLPRSH